MNLTEIGLSFIEGLALIASPCILPVLPLVLASSVDGGKRRPFGIITGFILSFSLFAFASRKLVSALHIDLDIIKYGSLILLALFALVLISGRLSEQFSFVTQGAANLGSKFASNQKTGYVSGVIIGALIGLVWTPCAGPILAAVLVQVIRQESDIAGFAIIISFAIGAAMPMLLIALSGRKLISHMGFLTQHAEIVRKSFGLVILLAVGFILSGIDPQRIFMPSDIVQTESKSKATALQNALPQSYPPPEFTGIETWLNSAPLTMSALKGKVVLIDFWTYSCINCVRTLPYLIAWDKKYRNDGLIIVGVHAPEFEFEKNVDNVRAAIAKHNIAYPVALDNGLHTWEAFNNKYWPAHYLINRDGQVVYTHFGEGNYAETENNIRYLLGLRDGVPTQAEQPAFSAEQSPETYLGFARAQHIAKENNSIPNATVEYTFPHTIALNDWALQGKWKAEAEKIVAMNAGTSLRLHFKAKKVFLVLGTATGTPVTARITLNGEPLAQNGGGDAPEGVVNIERNTLYELISQPEIREGLIEITANAAGVEAYAFTFGE